MTNASAMKVTSWSPIQEIVIVVLNNSCLHVCLHVEVQWCVREVIGEYEPFTPEAAMVWKGVEAAWQLAYDIMDGSVEGKRGRDRPKRTWPDDISDWTGENSTTCVREAEDQRKWQLITRPNGCKIAAGTT